MAAPQGGVEKATITNLDTNETVKCLFRPKEYTFSKTNIWPASTIKGKNVPKLEFSGGEATKLTMELFFDTYESSQDVRKHTNQICSLYG